MKRLPSTATVWFGVLGGPLAWGVQFVANLAFSYSECAVPGRFHDPVKPWAVALSVLALAVGLASTGVALWIYRRTLVLDDGDLHLKVLRGFGGQPPEARIHFLAVCGLVVNFLSLLIVVLTGIGEPLLTVCQQS